MIYLKFGCNDFKYEIEDIIKLFFSNNQIKYITLNPPEDNGGVFLSTYVLEEDEKTVFICKLVTGCNDNEKQLVEMKFIKPKSDIEKTNAIKNLKKEIKRKLYDVFQKATDKNPPWGVLTGIRPAKIIHEMLEQGKHKDEILENLVNDCRVSDGKAKLLYEVANAECSILDKTKKDRVSLYIGIPFCPSTCLYCSFTSSPIERYKTQVGSYLEALKIEMQGVGEILKKKSLRLQSVYIGGGTPTSLDEYYLEVLMNLVEECFELDEIEEYTLEAGRPDSINKAKLEVIRSSRVSRISINPQTMNDVTLKLIGRNHSVNDIIKIYHMAKGMDFKNINMDIIAGLPGENIDMFEHTLKEIKKLGSDSLTVHTMSIKRGARLNSEKEKYNLDTHEETVLMMDLAQKYAGDMGLHPYYLYRQKNIMGNLENLGYCKPGLESIYNIQIMEEKQTILAVGAGSVTKVVYPQENRIERAFNVKSVEDYLKRVEEMVERKKLLL